MKTERRYDANSIRAAWDLRDWVEGDLKTAPRYVRSTYSLFICPFHADDYPSLSVRQHDYRCFGCGVHGDIIDYVCKRDFANYASNIAFVKACEKLGGESSVVERERVQCERASRPKREELTYKSTPAPSISFQDALRAVIKQAQYDLHNTHKGSEALKYLKDKRGLRPGTIEAANIGYIYQKDGDGQERWRQIAGDLKLKLAFSEGLTFPWIADGVAWGIKVRRSYAQSKQYRYTQVTAEDAAKCEAYRPEMGGGLYWADYLVRGMPGLLIEGEINNLTIWQEAQDVICPISLGTAQEMIDERWLLPLARCKGLFALYDPDAAGQAGAERALKLSSRFCLVSLQGEKDINDLHTHSLASGELGAVAKWVHSILDNAAKQQS